jgi:hypothetical protein
MGKKNREDRKAWVMGDCCGHEERITGSLEVAEFAAEKEPSTYVTFAYVHSRISRYVRRVSV